MEQSDTSDTLSRLAKSLTQQDVLVRAAPQAAPVQAVVPDSQLVERVPTDEELKKRKEEQELNQQDKRFKEEMEKLSTDIELKKRIYKRVFQFLAVETVALFIVVLIQGFAPWHFHLDDSTINIFLGATLLQISSMAVIITRNLYPTS